MNTVKKAKKGIPKVFDGTFFTITKQTGDLIEARCAECNEVKKGNINTTGNFFSHYKSQHKDRIEDMKNYTKKVNTSTTEETTEAKKSRQPSITEAFKAPTVDMVCNKIKLFKIVEC